MSPISTFFNRFPFLQATDLEALYQIGVEKHYQAGEAFVQFGATRKKLGIVKEGLLRCYFTKSSGEEISILFAKEGEIASTHELIFYNQPSVQIVECLEPSTILVFDYRDIEQLAATNPRIEQLRNQFLQDYLIKVLKRLETFLLFTPEERYEWFIQEEPTLLQRVQQKYLASFLGITPVSLSRLRTRKAKR